MKGLLVISVAVAALFGSGAVNGVRAQDSQTVNELDPGFTVDIDMNKKLRLMFYTGREKSEEVDSSKVKVGGGASFRVKPVFKTKLLDHLDTDKHHALVLAAIFEYSRASETGSTKNENKLMLDATGRYVFPGKLLFSDRNRSELRWINGDFHYRYRNRAMFERPFKAGKRTLTPYGAAEAYWDSRYDKWSIFKFTGGVQIPLIRRTSLDAYYERQHCVTCSESQTNIYGLTLNVYFSRKK